MVLGIGPIYCIIGFNYLGDERFDSWKFSCVLNGDPCDGAYSVGTLSLIVRIIISAGCVKS